MKRALSLDDLEALEEKIAALEEAYRLAEQWIIDEKERKINLYDEYVSGIFDGLTIALGLLRGAFKDVIGEGK